MTALSTTELVHTPPDPFRHQQALFDDTKEAPAWFVAFEQGCGKSAPTVRTAVHLYLTEKLDGVVVLAPNGVHRNWLTDEIPKHSAIRWIGLDWHSDRASTKAQDNAFTALIAPTETRAPIAWLAISYEGMLTPKGRAAMLAFKQRYPRIMVVADEGSRIKNPTALRTKKAMAFRTLCRWARVLNGTPITNQVTDIYSQIRFLDERFWLRHGIGSFDAFIDRFAVTRLIPIGGEDDRYAEDDAVPFSRKASTPHGATKKMVDDYEQLDLDGIIESAAAAIAHAAPAATARVAPRTTGMTRKIIVGYKNLDQLKTMIAPITTRITKEDAGLDLPPKLYSRLIFDMTFEQRRIYEELRKNFMAELDNGVFIDASLALVRVMRLQQVACGFLPNPDDPENPKLFFNDEGKNPRIVTLMEKLEDTPHQSIIWARFTADVDAICRLLGPPRCARYDGEVSGKDRIISLDRFREGKAKTMVAKASSMGVGHTLVEAKSVFYYSNTFSLFERMQSEDRCHRIGQTSMVSYYDLLANKTVDFKILKSFQDRKNVADQVTGDRWRSWLEAA